MMRMTDAAIPPAMYANSDFSAQCFPVKLPIHLHDGCPRASFTQFPSFSQYPSHTSKNKKNHQFFCTIFKKSACNATHVCLSEN